MGLELTYEIMEYDETLVRANRQEKDWSEKDTDGKGKESD